MRILWMAVLVMVSGCGNTPQEKPIQEEKSKHQEEPGHQDMSAYRQETSKLEKKGKYAEALERHIWFHDNVLKHDEAMYGVRLSFALGEWLDLGEVYSPAREAFIEMRDKKTQMLLNGKGGSAEFSDVHAFNRSLDEQEKTVELFDHIDQHRQDIADSCWIFAKDILFEAKRYDLAKKYMPDLMHEFRDARNMYERHVEMSKDPRFADGEILEFGNNTFVKDILMLIEVAVSIGDVNAALEIQEKSHRYL